MPLFRFPAIVSEISEITSKVLQEEREKAKQVVVNIIDSELGYLFTNDLDYLSSRTSIIPVITSPDCSALLNFIISLRNKIIRRSLLMRTSSLLWSFVPESTPISSWL
jgi:hypothetical protein